MDKNLCEPILPLIELVVSSRGITEADFVGDDEAGLGFTRNDHITEVSIVCFDIALPGAHRQPLCTIR